MKMYFLKLLYQILFTKIDEEPISSEYSCPFTEKFFCKLLIINKLQALFYFMLKWGTQPLVEQIENEGL